MKILTNTRAALSGVAVAGLVAAGIALGAAPAQAAPTGVWDRVAQCESSGNWHINTGNGYYGGLQFSLATWRGYGGSGNPAAASKSEQIRIAEKVLAGQGWGAWPVCSVKAGARGYASAAKSGSSSGGSVSSNSGGSAQQDKPAAVKRPAAAKRPAAVKTSGKTVTVKTGDSLSKIAKRLDVDGGWKRLWAANPKVGDPDLIFVGQKLQLPA